MSQPTTDQGRPPGQDQFDEQALAFEKTLEALATAAILAFLTHLLVRARLHLQLGGNPGSWLAEQIRALRVDATAQVMSHIAAGVRLGATQALSDTATVGLPAGLGIDDATEAAVAGLDATIRAGVVEAAHLAAHVPVATEADVTTVLAPAVAATNRAGATTRWAANRAVNLGTAAVADAAGGELVWVAERNACLVCLALSGTMPGPDGLFDASLTFGTKPMPLFPLGDPQPLDHPPRHPSCRCRTRVWLPGSDLRWIDALRREAQRSVARGWSDYASAPARLTAADRLLRHPTLLAPTVRARAKRAVRAGTFTT